MARRKPWKVNDELGALIEPLLPRTQRRFRYPGRSRIDDRKTLQGLLFVLYTGIQWESLPPGLGFGSGPRRWRRLAEWREAGVRDVLQQVLLAKLRAADRLDFSPATVDSSQVQAKRGGDTPRKAGRVRWRSGRPGSKHHVITDAGGTPLRVSLTGGSRNDIAQLLPLVEALSPVRGHPRRESRQLCLARYDHDIYRSKLPDRGITPRIARRGHEHGSGLGALRGVAEAAVAWLRGPRRLRIR